MREREEWRGNSEKGFEMNPNLFKMNQATQWASKIRFLEKYFFKKFSQTALSATHTALSAKVSARWAKMRVKRALSALSAICRILNFQKKQQIDIMYRSKWVQ